VSHQPIVRRAKISDLKSLYEIEVECFREEAFPPSLIRRFLEDSRFITLVAVLEDKIVGFIAALIEDFMEEKVGHVYSIDVKPSYRRMGVGSRLLKSLEENLREVSVKICYLETCRDNLAAISFYLKHGYRACEILKNYYGAGRDGVRFAKRIGD
jgi:ribosomal-protein-alanine N-acetyltransferase